MVFSDLEWGTYLTAPIESDGRYQFRVTPQGGLPQGGVYDVAVTPPPVDAPVLISKTPPKAKSYPNIPAKYRNAKTSGLKLELTEPRQSFDIDMRP